MTTLTPASTQTSTAATHPEIELILCCCRTAIDTATTQRIKTLLQHNIDWAYLVQTALRHGVMPLLYQSLQSTCPDAIPKTILEQLRNHFHANAMHNLFLTKELLKLLNLFQDHDICAIPFKGPTLAAFAYSNLALRQFCDLDILVKKQEFIKAQNLLQTQGYQLIKQVSWQSCLVHHKSKVVIDLHHAITSKRFNVPLNCSRLWQRLEPISLTGTTIQNFSAENSLFILCIQLNTDIWGGWANLAKLCDIAQLIRSHQQLDWEFVIQQANTVGCRRMVLLALFLTSDILSTELPDNIWQRIQADPVIQTLAKTIPLRQRLLNPDQDPSEHWKPSRFYFQVRERLQEKLLCCLYQVLYYFVQSIPAVGRYGLERFRRTGL